MSTTCITLWTAGYHQHKTLLPPRPVNIARAPDLRITRGGHRHLHLLKPSPDTLTLARTEGDWKAAYLKELDARRRQGKLDRAIRLLRDGDCLMCWEREPHHCHRLLAAQYLAAKYEHITYAGEWWEHHPKERPDQTFLFGIL